MNMNIITFCCKVNSLKQIKNVHMLPYHIRMYKIAEKLIIHAPITPKINSYPTCT